MRTRRLRGIVPVFRQDAHHSHDKIKEHVGLTMIEYCNVVTRCLPEDMIAWCGNKLLDQGQANRDKQRSTPSLLLQVSTTRRKQQSIIHKSVIREIWTLVK